MHSKTHHETFKTHHVIEVTPQELQAALARQKGVSVAEKVASLPILAYECLSCYKIMANEADMQAHIFTHEGAPAKYAKVRNQRYLDKRSFNEENLDSSLDLEIRNSAVGGNTSSQRWTFLQKKRTEVLIFC